MVAEEKENGVNIYNQTKRGRGNQEQDGGRDGAQNENMASFDTPLTPTRTHSRYPTDGRFQLLFLVAKET